MKLFRTIALSSLLCFSALSSAGLGDGDLLKILRRAEVLSDMAIGEQQLSQITNLLSQFDLRVQELASKVQPEIKVGGFSLGKAPDPMNLVSKIQGEYKGQILKLLNPEQTQRALQIGIQSEGAFAVLMPEVTKQFNLEKDQKRTIEGFKKSALDLRRNLEKAAKTGEITPEEMKKRIDENDSTLQIEIQKILKDDQKGLLDLLSGKKLGGS